MKVVLIGHRGSQMVVPISKFLTGKYLGWRFDVRYVNFTGDINHWSAFLRGYLSALKDKYIIFSLDDYLLSDFIDMEVYENALRELSNINCIKLCHSTEQEHIEYSVTTQYSIWDRGTLINTLGCANTPWEFEIYGSRMFKNISIHRPCLKYHTNSALSARWEGIRLDGLKDEDIKYIKEHYL